MAEDITALHRESLNMEKEEAASIIALRMALNILKDHIHAGATADDIQECQNTVTVLQQKVRSARDWRRQYRQFCEMHPDLCPEKQDQEKDQEHGVSQ